jgi:hypothetical protein
MSDKIMVSGKAPGMQENEVISRKRDAVASHFRQGTDRPDGLGSFQVGFRFGKSLDHSGV